MHLSNSMGSVKSYSIFSFVIMFLITMDSYAVPTPWRDEDKRTGYVDTLQADDDDVSVPLYVVDNPNEGVPTLRDKIFNDTLTLEFSKKYQEKFGRTEAEVFYTHSSISDVYLYQGHEYTQEQYFTEQRNFSVYMIRRIGEYHFDKSAKNNPVTNSIYNIKEKMRNVDVAISPNFKLNAQYTISGNDLQVEAVNPWIISKVKFQMDPTQFTPTDVKTTTLNIGKKIDHNYQVDTYYTFERQMFQIIARRRLNDNASVSLTGSPNFYREDSRIREALLLGGLTWVF